ncbi:Restriction endonuclease S subunits [Vibrio antiquarius]|uniref:Restriction endonuclease S subunits n=2 Tax=Vibrio antiquarius (strain Ex25) TaxID=150340 RepID=A0ABM9WXD2_VIBAE|nr:restriction endonuclease subunit S [Vibrio antiquarius]ACY51395.1 type I restriction-modification system specificity subunit S [Vibrio antiquarius]EDN58075.1 Restriction endonuclease S subunits [Vibrio antiquarius]
MNLLTSMPKHNEYTDTGISWLGSIPSHWEAAPLCSVSKLKSITNHVGEPLLSVYLDKGVIRFDEVEAKRTNVTSLDLSKYQLVEPGDFVLNNQQAWRGSVGISAHRGIVSPAYLVLQLSSKIYPRFGNYLFRDGSMVANYLVNSKGVGTIQRNLYWPQLKRALVFFPGLDEQIAIANYLDEKTSQIDEAIAIKQKQIELLKERKQIIIQQAVTQGLNPDVPMKDSGVDWIGKIPEHWTVSKIGHYARVYNGSTPSRDVKRYWDEGTIPWMSSGKVNDYIISTPSELITTAALRECSLRIFPKGTVLIGIVGQGKTRGTSAMLAIDAVINQNVAGIIPSEKILSEFLHQYLIQAYDEVRNQGQGSNQEALNCQILSSFKIAFPSIIEQKEIVHFIAIQSQKLDQSIDIQFNQIEKLKEYKTTLINSAVTGKIKVTELV